MEIRIHASRIELFMKYIWNEIDGKVVFVTIDQ